MCYRVLAWWRRSITDDETIITDDETSITDDETDPSIIFAKLDKNEVKHFIGKIIVGKVLPFLKFFLFSNCYSKKQDGVLSLEEISLDIEEINLKGLLAMDLDKDGVISASEFDGDLSE